MKIYVSCPRKFRIESLESARSGSDFANNELIERFKRREGELWGFEDRIEYAVVYELDGVRFDGGVTMTRRDGKWFIATLNSRFANAPVFSGVRRRE